MGNFKQKLARFMSGRYGIDRLYYILFGIFIFFVFLSILFSRWFSVVAWIAVMYAFFRVFSRNIVARQKENALVLGFFGSIRQFFLRTAHRIRDHKTKRYRKCPHCKTVLKLPYQKGSHTVKCPICAHRFDVKF